MRTARTAVTGGLLIVGGVVALLAFGFAFNRSAGTRSAGSVDLVLDRPEVRAPACPSSGAMVWDYNRWTMTIGTASINFPFGAVGPAMEVFAGGAAADSAGGRRPGALYQKLPLHIREPAGTTFVVRGMQYFGGEPMVWDGPTTLSDRVPVAEQTFVPGQMVFPTPGCYQVFIDVAGSTYGPFGFVVRSSNPGEILASARSDAR